MHIHKSFTASAFKCFADLSKHYIQNKCTTKAFKLPNVLLQRKKKTFDSHMIKIYPFYTTLPVFKPMSAALIKRHLCLGTLVSIQKDCTQCLTEE